MAKSVSITHPEKPWLCEPDKFAWIDSTTGLKCYVRRAITYGHLCGYVRVGDGNKYFAVAFMNGGTDDLSVHGGISWASSHLPHLKAVGNEWWLGFDCGHCDDFAPGDAKWTQHGTYRTIKYVTREVERLAKQLAGFSLTED